MKDWVHECKGSCLRTYRDLIRFEGFLVFKEGEWLVYLSVRADRLVV